MDYWKVVTGAKGAKGVTEELKELLESCHGKRRC